VSYSPATIHAGTFVNSTGNTGSNASIVAVTVGANGLGNDGSFTISGEMTVSAFTAGTTQLTVTYTDQGGASRTAVMTFSAATTGALAQSVGAAGTFAGVPLWIHAQNGTTITVATVCSGWTGTYTVETQIKEEQ
jgi:hypothetical protein